MKKSYKLQMKHLADTVCQILNIDIITPKENHEILY